MRKHILIIILLTIFTIPSISASLIEDLEATQTKVQNFIDDPDNSIIIEGNYASFTEKTAMVFIRDRFPKVSNVQIIKESDINQEIIKDKSIILIGGPTQNSLTPDYLNDDSYSTETDELTAGKLIYLTSEEKSKVMIFSDYTGFNNLPKRIEKSPLAKFIPPQYIPAAATVIGLSLIWLWNLFGTIITRIFKTIGASKIIKWIRKKALKQEFHGLHIKGIRIKTREWIAILVAAAVFAVSLSFMYLAPEINVLLFLLATIFVNFLIYTIRNLTRLIMDKKHELHTEYMVWWTGAIITGLTAWFGNTFGLAGYIVSEDEEKNTKCEAKIAYYINLFTFLAFFIFWILNFLNPAYIVQMGMLLTLAIAFFQMLPIKPFAGLKIFKWSKGLWFITFIPLAIAYVWTNLLI